MNIALTPVRFLDRAITLFGSKTAVVCQGRRWTYAELGERVNRLANALVRLGVQPGDRVAFLGYNSHQLLECYYGIPMMGAVLLPLNIRLIAQDFEYICNDSEPKFLFLHPELLGKIEPIVSRIPAVKGFYLLDVMDNPPGWITGRYEDLLEGASPEPVCTSSDFRFQEDDMALRQLWCFNRARS